MDPAAVPPPPGPVRRARGAVRIAGGGGVLAVVAYAYALHIAAGDANPFDFFGYFTNQTSCLTAGVLILVGLLTT
ncbi:hypothetical protein ACIPVB_01245 [Microbacterium sp. NPDC090007]|uniref:hypothetical protein n=1 Tax=Microbacterium sp. NPDC090007 TaxID=3364204 RepID=UPI003812D341